MLKKQSPLSLLLLLLCLSTIKASELPIEAYSALPVMSMVRISPNGDRIAYRAVRSDEDYLVIKDIASDKIVGGLMLGDINPVSYTHLTLPTIA